MGNGAALTIMDRTSYSNKSWLTLCTRRRKIKHTGPVQATATGGNDAGKIQLTREGVVVASVSVPCRYIHSPVSVMNRRDYESCLNLVKAVLEEFDNNESLIESFKLHNVK